MNWDIFNQQDVFDIGSPSPSPSPFPGGQNARLNNIFRVCELSDRTVCIISYFYGQNNNCKMKSTCRKWRDVLNAMEDFEKWISQHTKRTQNSFSANYSSFSRSIRNLPITKIELEHPAKTFHVLGKYRVKVNRYLGDLIYKKENSKLLRFGDVNKFLIIICQGGEFAGLYSEGEKIVEHKTFSRYVVRKKQGKRQINKDKGKGGIHSAGSDIRRNNEIIFKQMCEKTLEKWEKFWNNKKDDLMVLVHAPGHYNKSLIFGDGKLNEKDERVFTIPYTIYNVNFTQVKSILNQILTVQVEIC